jgi:serine/threonine protein kinase/Tfp pilus assembly protein PilF
MIGKQISHYKILEKLGSGGMGDVYKAEDTQLKRTVALKFLPPELTRDPEAKARFLHEAQAASALDHPNICTIYETGTTDDGQSFIAMAYYEGETLREKIENNLPQVLNLREVLDIAIQIAQGLAKAHSHEIVHRDVKPANIMLTSDGLVKILDFGLARAAGQTKLTQSGSTVGTISYMSPEQAQGMEADHRTDIWSLGVLLYEMISGRRPFEGEYDQAILYSLVNEEPEPLTALRTGLPMELERIVNKCLAKSADERYQHADELHVDLHQCQRALASGKSDSVSRVSRKRIRKSRHLIPAAVVLVAAIGLAYFTDLFLPTQEDQSTERIMLAVLPFENLGEPEDAYFADGISDEILTKLSTIPQLGVIARESSFKYRSDEKSIAEIGQELGVQYILRGDIRWQRMAEGASRVRITPKLISVVENTNAWANIYDEKLEEIFAVQANVAEQITEALDIALLAPERQSLRARPTETLEAYDYYLQGMPYFRRSTQQDLQIAEQMFERAVDLDAKFALAYARLSEVHSSIYWYHFDRSDERLIKAKWAADLAFELKPELPDAHRAAAFYYYWGLLDYDKALEHFAIARRYRPNDSYINLGIGSVWRRKGKLEKAVAYHQKALEVDPHSALLALNLANSYVLLRNYAHVERYFDRANLLDPSWPRPYGHKALLDLLFILNLVLLVAAGIVNFAKF